MVSDITDIALKISLLILMAVVIKGLRRVNSWLNYKTLSMWTSIDALELDLMRQACDDAIRAVDKLAAAKDKINNGMESKAKKQEAVRIAGQIIQQLGVSTKKAVLLDDMIESVLGMHMIKHNHNHDHDNDYHGEEDNDDYSS